MKRHPTSLDIKKLQMRTSMRYRYTLPKCLQFKYNSQCQVVGDCERTEIFMLNNESVNQEFVATIEGNHTHTL